MIKTATWTWLSVIKDVMERGIESRPRDMRIRELLGYTSSLDMRYPVVSAVERKLQRKFLAGEAYWILTGDNRASTISPYNSAIAKFSDDGRYFSGAYGPQVVQQLPYVVDSLEKDHDSRQAVMTIWKPSPRPSKDIPCLDGSSNINSPEGNVTIQKLAEMFSGGLRRYPVFVFDKFDRKVKLAYCTGAWKTGIKPRLKFIFDDGSSLITTHDHVLFKKTRSHVEGEAPKSSRTFVEEVPARNLRVGNRLWATTFVVSGPQDRPAFIEDLTTNWHRHNQKMVHRAYAEFLYGEIPDGVDVHHKDGNPWNNKEENLELLPHDSHSALKMFGSSNPMSRETDDEKQARRMKLRQTWIDRGFDVKPLEYYECNHKIIGIEEVGDGEVYDFQVPGYENAVVGNGIIAHNCTVSVQWFLRKKIDGVGVETDEIHCVDTMRSSDCWLGWGYDVFNFTMLTACVALLLRERGRGMPRLGTLTMQCGSQHVYDNNWEQVTRILHGEPQNERKTFFDVPTVPYAEFDPSDFASMDDLLEHLTVVRDARTGDMRHEFMREFMP